MSAKLHFRPHINNQLVLFPQRIDEDIAPNDPVRLVNSVVDGLDLERFRKLYRERGRSPYHPRMMLKVIIYAYMNNIYSCRRIEQSLRRDIHYIWLAGYEKPDFLTINRFRNRVKGEIDNVFTRQHHFADRAVEVWEGFTFEEVCLRHLPHIKYGLGISGIPTEASAWRFVPRKDDKRKGAQFDLVIKRVDKIVHLVEMKFAANVYSINKDYAQRLSERKDLFSQVTGISRGAVITMITPKGLAEGKHSSLVHSQLTARHLFAQLD